MQIRNARVGHQNTIVSLAFSPDGRNIVSGSWDGTAKVWNALSGELLFTFSWGSRQVNHVAWSPDGTTIAVAGDPPDSELDEKQLASYQSYFDHRDTSCFDVQDDTTDASELRLYAADDGRFLRSFDELGGGVAFSPDGSKMAAISWNGLCIIERETATAIAHYDNENLGLRSVFYSRDGKDIACVSSDGVHVIDALSATAVRTVPVCHDGCFFNQCEDPENETAYIKRFWQQHLPGFSPVSCSDHGSEMQRICFCPARTRAAIVPQLHDHNVLLVDASGDALDVCASLESGIRTASFSPDGTCLAVAGDGQNIRIWDLSTMNERIPIGAPPVSLSSVAYSPNASFVAVGNRSGDFGVFDSNYLHLVASYSLGGQSGFFLDFGSKGDFLAIGCETGEVEIVSFPDFERITRVATLHERFYGGMVSSDDAHLYGVFGSDSRNKEYKAELICWSILHERVENRRSLPDGSHVTSVCASPSRHQMAIATTNAVYLADVSSEATLKSFVMKEKSMIEKLVFVGDDELLIANEGYGMQLVDINQKKLIRSFVATRDGPNCLSAFGDLLVRATAYFKEIEQFELASGTLKRYYRGNRNCVSGLAVSKHQKNTLVSAGDDGTLKLWDMESGELKKSVVVEL